MAAAESVDSLVRQCGAADIIVNNAGNFPSALTVDQGMAALQTRFDTNVRGPYFLVAGLVAGMLRRGRGGIVNITTMAAFKGIPGASGYSVQGCPGIPHPYLGRRVRVGRGAGQQCCSWPDTHGRGRRRMGRRQ